MSDLGTLKAAFDAGRLAAVHVDLQDKYLAVKDQYAERAIVRINAVSSMLRDANIANHWVAYSDLGRVHTHSAFKNLCEARDETRHHRISPLLSAKPDDLVFEKQSWNAFEQEWPALTTHLQDNKIDTVLVTGIYYCGCVQETIVGAIKSGFNVCAIADATDCPDTRFGEWERDIIKDLRGHDTPGRLQVTDSAAVLRMLL